jgi:hypothetical protein
MKMAIDYDTTLSARARAAATGNSMALFVGAVLITGIIAMVAVFAAVTGRQ